LIGAAEILPADGASQWSQNKKKPATLVIPSAAGVSVDKKSPRRLAGG